ncbi:hypothetical protein G6F40_018255 [Rhizopus arrhizus]|nr:hypothetical protein G6F40_018255 [Rhizopus arrhizus]
MAGTSAAPVRVSHKTAVARCVASATAAICCPARWAWAMVARQTLIVFSRISLASSSTTPGRGVTTGSV